MTDSYRRLDATTNSAGNDTTTQYYGVAVSQMRDNPCTSGDPTVHQGGQPYRIFGPAPGDNTAPRRVEELVYDIAGRPVASRVGTTSSWTCTTYDDRGRPTEVEIGAFGGQPARQVEYDYAHPDQTGDENPLLTAVRDSTNGVWVTTHVDLLGRTLATSDEWGKSTAVEYDRLGRRISSTGEGGELTYRYATGPPDAQVPDPYGRLRSMSLDGEVLAEVTYDSLSRIDNVVYPSGTGNAGNGTRLHDIAYDALGRTIGIDWQTAANSPITSASRSFDNNGRVVNDVIDGIDARPGENNYVYDGVGRLTDAWVRDPVPDPDATRYFEYGYAHSGGCGVSGDAGKRTNRTSMTVDGGTPTMYCYNHADRLTSTSVAGFGTIAYDNRGNMTTYRDATLVYDSSGRHIETTVDGETLRYKRSASGAIIERDAPGDGAGSEATLRYSSGPAGMGLVLNIGGTIVERSIGLPGGATLSLPTVGAEKWSYPNLNGSVAAIADDTGTKIGDTHHYDPYGNPLGELPDNRDGSADSGWMGAGTEHSADFPELIEMGARVYSPELGRFLQVDPVQNGSANDYDYAAGDPVNYADTTGKEPYPHHCRVDCQPPPVAVSCWGWECGAIANHAYEARLIQSQQNAARAAGYADYLAYVAAAAYWAAYVAHQQEIWKASVSTPSLATRTHSDSGFWSVTADRLGDAFSVVGNILDYGCAAGLVATAVTGGVAGGALVLCVASAAYGVGATVSYLSDGNYSAAACAAGGTALGLGGPTRAVAGAVTGTRCLGV